MMQRIRKSMEEKDQGFTLIELLVVIIIIGILSAIAIPIFLNQRKKAVDAAARADATTVAKQVATYFVDNTDVPVLAISADGTHYTLTGAGVASGDENIGPVSGELQGNTPATTIALTPADADASTFVVTLTYTGGTVSAVYYNATTGLGTTP